MDLTSALMAYDKEMEKARLERREPTTAEKIHALRAAIEAYEGDKSNVAPPTRGTDSQLSANVSVLSNKEIDEITWREHPEGRCTVSTLRELAKAIESEVASRFRVQGGITKPEKE